MDKIRLKNIKNNIDCVELWNYLKNNQGSSLPDLMNVFSNENWREIRKTGKSFCSNLVYCLKKLRKEGAIQIIQNRNDGGEFDFSSIEILREPIVVDVVKLKTCEECGGEFKKKNSQSKYQELCQDCTKKRFMVSPEICCSYCAESGPRNKMRIHKQLAYHKECFQFYKIESKKQNMNKRAEERRRNRVCTACGEVCDISKHGRFCKPCREIRHSERLKKSFTQRLCVSCGEVAKRASSVCDNINCLSIYYIMIDAPYRPKLQDEKYTLTKKATLGKTCIVCGYSNFVQYHHVIYRENGGPDSLSNIVPICPNHHMEVHHCGLDISEYHKKVLQRLDDIKNGLIEITL